MAGWIAERYGNFGLKDASVCYEYEGVAGQSFGSYATAGMEVTLIGEANEHKDLPFPDSLYFQNCQRHHKHKRYHQTSQPQNYDNRWYGGYSDWRSQ